MLKLMIEGVKFEFCIEKYRPNTQENWDDEWCMVTARVKNNVINYDIHCECMLCAEVEWLYNKLGELQDGLLINDTEISFIEPDFEYVLYLTATEIAIWIGSLTFGTMEFLQQTVLQSCLTLRKLGD